jgi:hypothetical protein
MATATSYELDLAASRYTDVLDEPLIPHRTPITDFEHTPLVTFEESIKPIAHFFDEIEIKTLMTQRGMTNLPDGLSIDESRSIHLYTMSFDSDLSLSQVLNKALRDEDHQSLKPWYPFLKLFLTGLSELPSEDMTVWCGVRNVDLRSKYPIGSKLT